MPFDAASGPSGAAKGRRLIKLSDKLLGRNNSGGKWRRRRRRGRGRGAEDQTNNTVRARGREKLKGRVNKCAWKMSPITLPGEEEEGKRFSDGFTHDKLEDDGTPGNITKSPSPVEFQSRSSSRRCGGSMTRCLVVDEKEIGQNERSGDREEVPFLLTNTWTPWPFKLGRLLTNPSILDAFKTDESKSSLKSVTERLECLRQVRVIREQATSLPGQVSCLSM
ncbi:hypothetical protein EYF80_025133 [Liparis tanakae]|uniref:Uncharacterized protein n=1 Tax=Liparis tanakae TaxID=230148 RepID=A0A4Z2HI87_9TELE|nr:hypothetical protein EYF80_025133 [Liparis tanakae]